MTAHPFQTSFTSLPASLPVFPLTGALLLPGGRLHQHLRAALSRDD